MANHSGIGLATEGNDIVYGSATDFGPTPPSGKSRALQNHNDAILGLSGNDFIFGDLSSELQNYGDDVIDGGDGNDTIFGDTVNASSSALTGLTHVTIRLANGIDVKITAAKDWYSTQAGGDDEIDGGDGDDRIYGGGGADIIRGGDDDDYLNGGAGVDKLYGDAGHDVIYGLGGDDRLEGGADNDRIFGNSGNDRLYGGSGNDHLRGGYGHDYLDGGSGNDTYWLMAGNDTVVDSSGMDTIVSSTDRSLADYTGIENLTLIGDRSSNRMNIIGRGSDGDNHITTSGTLFFQLRGGKGDDILEGSSGPDILHGNSGEDRLFGGGGADNLRGGYGQDYLEGGAGDDIYWLMAGDDTVVDTSGISDAIVSSISRSLEDYTGIERLEIESDVGVTAGGNASDNYILGGKGDDIIYGRAGDDIIQGEAGDDTMYGGDDNDFVKGGAGDDTLYGGAGNDRLAGLDDNNTLTGGAGKDAFFFTETFKAGKVDAITDFSVEDDKIEIREILFDDMMAGELASSAFVKNTTGQAEDANDRIIYNSLAGKLYVDLDGNGSEDRILFATVTAGLNMTAADFIIVG